MQKEDIVVVQTGSMVPVDGEVAANMKNTQEKILAISHCNCEERAKAVRDMLLERASFKDVIILDTAGISSMYAADGGVIVVV